MSEFPKELAAKMVADASVDSKIRNGMVSAYKTKFRDTHSLNDLSVLALRSF